MQRSLELFKLIAKHNPKFNNELCNMFGGVIPSYIKNMAVKYDNDNNNNTDKLCSKEFMNTIPTYMLANACENKPPLNCDYNDYIKINN